MRRIVQVLSIGVVLLFPAILFARPADVIFSAAPTTPIDRFDYIEITVNIQSPDVHNPFEDASLTGTLETTDGSQHWSVEGFADAKDGSIFRIRFMAPLEATYKYTVTYRQADFEKSSSGTFSAVEAHRRGILAIDPDYPWHFIWQGTGEHFFFNGTTAYFLMGWKDERTIRYSIERLHRLKVNRMRVSIAGREDTMFGERVMNGPSWSIFLTPWPAQNTADYYHPGFDYSRFSLWYWQRFERMLKYARELDMNISLVLDMNDSHVHPAAGSADEHRYIQYAVDRFAAFSNITWDLGDDLDSFRDEHWTHETGTLLQGWDPYKHLETCHPGHIEHLDRASAWFGFTSYQEWSRDQHRLILESRKLQEKTGRIIPQTNEEYGYEDHYPLWALPNSESADVLRRTAWDIAMAGGYQTTGETARQGTNIWPDLGGGWMNGRGDDTMTMLLGYGHMVDFFTGFAWWKTNPHDEFVTPGNYCLADPGKTYAVYLPHGGKVTVQLEPGHYRGFWFSAMTGEKIDLPNIDGPTWSSPETPDNNDWALLIESKS